MSRATPERVAAARVKLATARARTGAPKPSRRKRWLALALLVALLAMLQDCSCNQAPVLQPCVQVAAVEVGAPPPPAPPDDRRMPRRDRPELHPAPAPAPPWLAAFRMQVAARSPRLARCLIGADRPGRLRWTTTVEPTLGAVSEHVVEPTLQGDELTASERTCVLEALSVPPYRLEGGDARATPSRVSLVLEF